MKLTVWIATQSADSQCYNVVARTKKAALEQIANSYRPSEYSAPKKIVIEYKDAFDLFEYVTGEAGGRHEYL